MELWKELSNLSWRVMQVWWKPCWDSDCVWKPSLEHAHRSCYSFVSQAVIFGVSQNALLKRHERCFQNGSQLSNYFKENFLGFITNSAWNKSSFFFSESIFKNHRTSVSEIKKLKRIFFGNCFDTDFANIKSSFCQIISEIIYTR